MLRASVILLLTVFSILSSTDGAKSGAEQLEQVVREFECKGEKINSDLLMSQLNKNCKKEIGTSFPCAIACFYKTLGLYENDYRYFENEDKAIERMIKTKVMTKKLAKLLAEALKDSSCKSKFPSKGTDGCTKAIPGTVCVAQKFNKFCNLRVDKLIAASS